MRSSNNFIKTTAHYFQIGCQMIESIGIKSSGKFQWHYKYFEHYESIEECMI